MITCFVRYEVKPGTLESFGTYARAWIEAVEALGGLHHGYFLPADAESHEAIALFSFPNMQAFLEYKERRKSDPLCAAAYEIAEVTGCIVGYEGRFMRAILPSKC